MQRMWRKKRVRKLETVDKWLYALILVLGFVLLLGSLFVFLTWTDRIAFTDPTVIAAAPHNSALLWVPLWFYLFCSFFFPWLLAFDDKRPILGKKSPYPIPARPRLLPKRTAILLKVAIFLLCCALVPFSIYGRDQLHADGSITVYDTSNRQTEVHAPEELEAARFGLYGRKYSFDYHVQADLWLTNGQCYRFSSDDIQGDADELPWLSHMLDIKARIDPERITLEKTYILERIAYQWGDRISAEEWDLLYQLFDVHERT